MPSTRGAFSQLLAPGLFSVIYEDLEMHPEEYSQLFNVYPSEMAYEEDQLIAGLGAVPTKPEGTSIALDEPIEGGSVRFTHVSYGLGFQVTREMWDDDKYGIMRRVSQDFGGSIRQTVESGYASVLVNGFTTTKNINGNTLFSTAQPLLGGGTYSNRSATDIAFSVTGLQELTLLFEKMVNERGLLKRTMPEQVWFPPDIQFKAGEILHSAYKPYTGTNEVNTMQGRFTPHVNHYFSNPTQWFMVSAKRGHTLKGYWRTQPQFDSQDDFMTKGASFSVFFRFSTGVTYWHGVAGSNGA
jgi:Mu-like prophage major head subunit gpT